MTNLAPVKPRTDALAIPAPAIPLALRWEDALLRANDRYKRDLKAIPPEHLPAIRAELEDALAARPEARFVQAAALRLVGSFPQNRGPADPATYLEALAEAMAGFPPDALLPAIRQIVRGSKFLPSVAEFVEAANAVIERRWQMLEGVKSLQFWIEYHRPAAAALTRSSERVAPRESPAGAPSATAKPPREPYRQPTPDEVKAMVAGWSKELGL